MNKLTKRVLSLALAVLMLLPLVSIPTFATTDTNGVQDFESFTAGQTLTTSNGFSVVSPINKVIEENGNKFLRLPIACQDTANVRTAPTNRGSWFIINHAAFSASEKTSIKVDLRINGIGGAIPNIGLWLRKVSYTNASGAVASIDYFRLFDVNLVSGALIFKNGTATLTGATGLTTTGWNNVEVLFNPADGSFAVYINNVLYATCVLSVTGTNFTVAANQLMYCVCSSNNTANYTAVATLDDTYSNANYMDADNFKVAVAADKTGVVADFDGFAAGNTLTASNGFVAVVPINKVLVESGNKFLRLPIACQDTTDPRVTPTNRGQVFQFKHAAFSTTEKTSITVDLRRNGLGGTNPVIGLWLKSVGYTNASGTAATQNWYRLVDFNLLTGEAAFIGGVKGTKTGAAGLVADAWNAVEVVFNPANGSYNIYINDVLYANCTAPVAGTNFTVAANQLMLAVCSSNNANVYTATASLNASYSNANYMDADNLAIGRAIREPILDEGFENCTVGSTLATSDGFARVIPFSKVLEENGNKFLRLPMASTQAGSDANIKVTPTNRGNWMTFKHGAFSTTENTLLSMDLRINGVSDSNQPNIGVWINKFSYTDTNGASASKSYVRLFDVNLLTGELMTRDVNGTTTGAKGLILGEWNSVEVVFDPKTGAFDIYINDALYKQCTAIVEGTNFVVGANQLMFCVCSSNNYKNYTAASSLDSTYSNCNYMDGDNFKILETNRKVTGKIYYSETFNSYTPGASVALGTTPHATATYERDPNNANNVVVKVPFGPVKNDAEILMRMSGTVPMEHKPTHATSPQIGYFEVTRNAETNAVEVAGWTVTEEAGGTYAISDGTTTFTGLKLTTKDDYYGYWGADGAIDCNWRLPTPVIAYNKEASVVLSVDYYFSEDAYGSILAQIYGYMTDSTSKNYLDLFYINPATGSVAPKGGSTYSGVLEKGKWNNVMLELDLVSGVGKIYANGEYLGDGTYVTNLTIKEANVMVAKMNRKFANYRLYDGYFMVDNVKLMTSSQTVTVDSDRLMYVEVDGRRIYSNTFNLPEGSTYKAVYFKDEDYAGLLTTETKSSVRLATAAGLRFATRVDTSVLDRLYTYLDKGDLEDVTLGTLIAPADYVNGELTVSAMEQAGKRYLCVDSTRDKYFEFDLDADTVHFVGSIVNLYENNIDRDFSARGYARVTLKSGQELLLYSSVAHSADVKDIATRVAADTAYVATLSAAQKEILDTFVAGKQPPLTEEVAHLRKLDGLNVLAFGDSLFHGDAVGYSEQWIARLARRHSWNLTNLGRNGWTLAYAPDVSTRASIYNNLMNNADFKYGTTASTYFNYGNAQSLSAADVDLILLEGGTNDFGSNIPIGTIDSTDCGTLMGATNLIVEKLLKDYPNATVVFVTSWHLSGYKTINGASVAFLDYTANSMKQLYQAHYASNPRVAIVDAGNPAVTGVNMEDASFRATYSIASGDKCHLNVEGMKIMESVMPKILADTLFVCSAVDGMSTSHSYDANRKCTECDYVDPASVKEEGITRVVCVGDSITAGGYWKNNLQGNLDSSYEVLGFGVSGSTGFAAGFDSLATPKAYVNQPACAESLRTNADIVVIMLGTNDTKGYNYNRIKADGGAQYKKDMIALIEGYQAMGADPQIFLGLPPTIFREWTENGINDEALQELLIDLIKEIAAETDAIVVDVHTATADASAHFSDGVHPSDDTGRGLIAKAFADAILANANS